MKRPTHKDFMDAVEWLRVNAGRGALPINYAGLIREYVDDLRAQSWPEPIKTSERLPDENVNVLVSRTDGSHTEAWLVAFVSEDGRWLDDNNAMALEPMDDEWVVTHWLPMPPAQKDAKVCEDEPGGRGRGGEEGVC